MARVVVDWKPVVRAFREVDAQLKVKLGEDLKDAAAPVVRSAQQKDSVYAGASVNTIRSRRMGPRVWVTQGAKKVDGHHPDFGALQMTHVLIPARDEHETEVATSINEALDRYAIVAGF